jgi:hypothetical protein
LIRTSILCFWGFFVFLDTVCYFFFFSFRILRAAMSANRVLQTLDQRLRVHLDPSAISFWMLCRLSVCQVAVYLGFSIKILTDSLSADSITALLKGSCILLFIEGLQAFCTCASSI